MICNNCPHSCDITDYFKGICKTRTIKNNKIVNANYGQITSIALDPIEKKPLKRFMEGSRILSIGSWGCNMFCPWCQNDSISRGIAEYREFSPEDIVNIAIREKTNGNIGIAYTYNEALVGFDFVLDTAKLAKRAGLKNVLITNAMAKAEVFDSILEYMDAINIDLKTIDSGKYRGIGGDYDTILRNIKEASAKCHVELTTLIVPGFNDSKDDMEMEAKLIAEIDKEIPLHISRFFPAGDMKGAFPTSVDLIYELKDIAKKSLSYVYTGNC